MKRHPEAKTNEKDLSKDYAVGKKRFARKMNLPSLPFTQGYIGAA
jgi:hypothetical protein